MKAALTKRTLHERHGKYLSNERVLAFDPLVEDTGINEDLIVAATLPLSTARAKGFSTWDN